MTNDTSQIREAYSIATAVFQGASTFTLQPYMKQAVPVLGYGYLPVRLFRGQWHAMAHVGPDLKAVGGDHNDDPHLLYEILDDLVEVLNMPSAYSKDIGAGFLKELQAYHLTPAQQEALFALDYRRYHGVTRSQLGLATFDALSLRRQAALGLISRFSPEVFCDLLAKGLKALVEDCDWPTLQKVCAGLDDRLGCDGKFSALAAYVN